LFFHMHDGFVEALVRGYRSGFLGDVDYHQLTQCENLDDVKLNLQETDYDQFLANESGKLNTAMIQKATLHKLVKEFEFLRSNAEQPLAQFMDFITYEYMIDNVMLLLNGSLKGRNINELIEKIHPLGKIPESTMRSIAAFTDASRSSYEDLYQTVLLDTPVGPYFSQFLKESSGGAIDTSEIQNVLEEVQMEIIKNSLHKLYLEDFYQFCQTVGGDTADVMCEVLRARADRAAINITLNSFNTPLNEPSMRTSDRQNLLPSFGNLYPEGTAMLSDVGDEHQLGSVLEKYVAYKKIWEVHLNEETDGKSIDDAFFERDVQMLEIAFDGQCHYGCFYSYVKLKEQEIRNLVWISECIAQNQRDEIAKYVPIFSTHAPWKNQK